MSCRRDPAPASSGHRADRRCDDPVQPCPLHCPPLEIEVNNTPATDDDYVQIKCTFPPGRHRVPCRIRVRNAGPESPTIVLTNPDGRLRFPGDTDTTKTLSVPANGSWASFEISGETGSNALDDAVIEAHCQTPTGAVLATKTVTVFWFDQAQIGVTAGGSYSVVAGRFEPVGGNAVNYSAQARLRPAGARCAAPQIANLRIGILQNGLAPATRTLRYDNPTIGWSSGVAPGTTVSVPTTIELSWSQTGDANDSAASVAPLYDQPGKADQLDANSLRPPLGCTNGGAATSFDSPSGGAAATLTQDARSAAGAVVGTITYRFVNRSEDSAFITWAALFDTVTHEVCALRERTWSLHIDSAGAGPQRATPAATDRAPTQVPIVGGAFANTLQRQSGPTAVGPATTTFTR